MEMAAQDIADIYKRRWQVELFFKRIKQNLKIKSFWGTSMNAVFSQIWIALIISVLLWIGKTLAGITATPLQI
jgi:IS4 transposase